MCGIGGGPGGGEGSPGDVTAGNGAGFGVGFGQGDYGGGFPGTAPGTPAGGMGAGAGGISIGGNVADAGMPGLFGGGGGIAGTGLAGDIGFGDPGIPFGATPGALTNLGKVDFSDIAGFNIGKALMGLIAGFAGIAGTSNPALGIPLGIAGLMAHAARGAGQPPGDLAPGMAAGANPGGIGGPGGGMDLSSLTTGMGLNPLLQNTEQQKTPSISQPRSVTMPVGDITSSLFSVPPPKVNIRNLMAARGVRGAGTKTALPEWFTQGKRGY